MEKIIDKLSTYNIFNYLLPGTVFCFLLEQLKLLSFNQESIIIKLILFYFAGMIISRIGSLGLEEFLKKVKFLKFSQYEEFIDASKIDPKIEEFSEINNTYRTICTTFIVLLFLKLSQLIILHFQFGFLRNYAMEVVIFFLGILFLFSYQKQTNYITKRIKKALNRN